MVSVHVIEDSRSLYSKTMQDNFSYEKYAFVPVNAKFHKVNDASSTTFSESHFQSDTIYFYTLQHMVNSLQLVSYYNLNQQVHTILLYL